MASPASVSAGEQACLWAEGLEAGPMLLKLRARGRREAGTQTWRVRAGSQGAESPYSRSTGPVEPVGPWKLYLT